MVQYKDILYKEFSKERVDKELDEFLDKPIGHRYGGGSGVTSNEHYEKYGK